MKLGTRLVGRESSSLKLLLPTSEPARLFAALTFLEGAAELALEFKRELASDDCFEICLRDVVLAPCFRACFRRDSAVWSCIVNAVRAP